jgi:hypothetical protein
LSPGTFLSAKDAKVKREFEQKKAKETKTDQVGDLGKFIRLQDIESQHFPPRRSRKKLNLGQGRLVGVSASSPGGAGDVLSCEDGSEAPKPWKENSLG